MKYRAAINGIQHFVEEQDDMEWKIIKVFYSRKAATDYILKNKKAKL